MVYENGKNIEQSNVPNGINSSINYGQVNHEDTMVIYNNKKATSFLIGE
jgi:hypothetical protein